MRCNIEVSERMAFICVLWALISRFIIVSRQIMNLPLNVGWMPTNHFTAFLLSLHIFNIAKWFDWQSNQHSIDTIEIFEVYMDPHVRASNDSHKNIDMCYNVCIAHFQIVELERMYAFMQLYVSYIHKLASINKRTLFSHWLQMRSSAYVSVRVSNDILQRRQISMLSNHWDKNHKLGTNTHVPLNYCIHIFWITIDIFGRLQAYDCLCFDETTFE